MDTKQLVLITGGTSVTSIGSEKMTDNLLVANGGIGFELARQLLVDSKKHVLLGSRSIEKGENALKELQSQQPKGTVEVIQVDVASEDSVAAAAKEVENRHGRYVNGSSAASFWASGAQPHGANLSSSTDSTP